jgi:HNH endonuclease
MERRDADYYEARGFSVYYLANVVSNVVATPGAYIRNIEDILGDVRTEFFMKPFTKYTNLHEFIRCISLDIILEDVERDDGNILYLQRFLEKFGVPCPTEAFENQDTFAEFTGGSERFQDAIDEIADEIFHVLFGDIVFLQAFNRLCADYIEGSGVGVQYTIRAGTLKRITIPVWAKRSIFHRDKGECRNCKKDLAAIINRLDTERYDHIVPLASYGANDVTNLQLLCEPCNLKKSADDIPVSRLYQRAIPR